MESTSIGRPTFGGLASGLDTNALLSGLLQIERIPLNRLQSRRSQIDAQRGLMRELNTRVLALRSAAQELDNRNSAGTGAAVSEEFLRYSGSSSNEDIVRVSAGKGAAPGEIDVKVLSLARGSRRFSQTMTAAEKSTALSGTQTLTISLDNADPTTFPPIEATLIEINANGGTLSLETLRDQINTSAGNGGKIRADILQINDDAYRLVLSSTGTGASNEIMLTTDLAMEAPVVGRDDAASARIELFGQEIVRESNLIEDALTGITIRVMDTSEIDEDDPTYDPAGIPPVLPLKAETLTVEVDIDEVAAALEKFTKAYNDVLSFIDAQFKYDETNKQSGPLSGDFTLREIQRQLQEFVSRGYKFSENPANPFADQTNGGQGGAVSGIGLEILAGGKLRVNKETLEEAMALDPESVREFLSGRNFVGGNATTGADVWEEGFATRVSNSLEVMVRSGDGILAGRDQSFASRLKDFDLSIERFEFRLGQREETLIQRFSELERIVSGLQSQQGFLTSLA